MADQRTIEILLKARDEASRTLEQFSAKSLAGMAASAAAAFLSVSKLTESIRAGIKAASEQETALHRLSFALRSVGEESQEALKHSQALAEALQQQTKYSDDAIEEAQAMLAMLGRLSGEGLDRATRASLDLATALGVDLQQAATLVAKAAEGQTAALSRYGIVIQEDLAPMEKYEAVLRAIEQNMGGAAQAELGTYAGTVENLANKWGEAAEQWGNFWKDSFAVTALQAISDKAAEATTAMLSFLNTTRPFVGGSQVAERPFDARDPANPNAGVTEGPFPSAKDREEMEREFQKTRDAIAAAEQFNQAALAEAERQRDQDRQERAERHQERQEEMMMREVEHNREMQEREHERGVRWLEMLNRAHLALTKAQGQQIAQAAINSAKEIKFSDEERKEKIQNAIVVAGATVQLAGEAFERTKAMRIAETIINTWEGVVEALPNYYLAAAVAATGALAVNNIRRTKYALGGFVTGGFPGQDSVPAMLMPGEYVIPAHEVARQQAGASAAAGGISINLHFTGATDASGVPESARNLARQIKDVVERSGVALTATHIMRNGVPVAGGRL
jgi:hypothetical protein